MAHASCICSAATDGPQLLAKIRACSRQQMPWVSALCGISLQRLEITTTATAAAGELAKIVRRACERKCAPIVLKHGSLEPSQIAVHNHDVHVRKWQKFGMAITLIKDGFSGLDSISSSYLLPPLPP